MVEVGRGGKIEMAVDVGGWVNSRMKRLVLEMVKSRSKRSAAVVDKIMGIGRGGGGGVKKD